MISCECLLLVFFFFFQAEDGFRVVQESVGLGEVFKSQGPLGAKFLFDKFFVFFLPGGPGMSWVPQLLFDSWLLYTFDGGDGLPCCGFGCPRNIKKKKRYILSRWI